MTGFTLKSSKPETLAPFSLQVFDTLARYTAFPWPVMLAQCKRANLDPAALTPQDLAKVLDFIAEGIGRFTTPEKGLAVQRDLQRLVELG